MPKGLNPHVNTTMTTSYTIECDFSNPLHCQKLIELMNAYIKDKMGGGEIIAGEREYQLLEGLKNHPRSLVLFAQYQNQLVGLANCFVNFSTFACKPYINIHDFVVHPNFRGKKIAKTLMKGIIDRALEMDCAKVNLEVRDDNTKAQNLYQQFGFKPSEPDMWFWQLYLTQ